MSPRTLYKSKLKFPITHRDLEGTIRDVLPSKTDADDILARLWRCVENVKRAVLVFNNVHVKLGPLRSAHAARHLAFPGGLCVHRDDCLLPNLDCWANTSSLTIRKKESAVRCKLLGFFCFIFPPHSLTHRIFSMRIPFPWDQVKIGWDLVMLFPSTVCCYHDSYVIFTQFPCRTEN